MTKLLILGDLHITDKRPVNRKDDYQAAISNKLIEIFGIAKERKVEAILCMGDVFNNPTVSITLLMWATELFEQCPVPFYVTPGNHDLFSYNLNTYNRTSLMLLSRLVPNFHVKTSRDHSTLIGNSRIDFQEHSANVDTENLNAYYMDNTDDASVNIKVVHGMLLDHEPPFEPYTTLDKVDTNADVLLTGHDHRGFGVKKVGDTLCVNLGSLMRSASNEVDRRPRVGVLDTDTIQVEVLNLNTAEPGLSVFDMQAVQDKKERDEYVKNFKNLVDDLKTETDLSSEALLKTVAKQLKSDKNVLNLALDRLVQQQQGGEL